MNEARENDMHAMTAPNWKWELNPNSIAAILGILLTIGGWGYVYAEIVTGTTTASTEVGKLWAEIAVLKGNNSRVESLEYRMTTVEGLAREGIASNRETAAALNNLASDQRVMKEILQRIEAAQTADRKTRL